jgi:hypothetical protein
MRPAADPNLITWEAFYMMSFGWRYSLIPLSKERLTEKMGESPI